MLIQLSSGEHPVYGRYPGRVWKVPRAVIPFAEGSVVLCIPFNLYAYRCVLAHSTLTPNIFIAICVCTVNSTSHNKIYIQ